MRVIPWTKAICGALIVLMGLGVAAPAASAEVAGAAPSKPLSLAAAAQAKVATLDVAAAVALTQTGAPATGGSDKPFFKTRKGVAVLVLMAGGIAYTAISRSKDAVHSPAR